MTSSRAKRKHEKEEVRSMSEEKLIALRRQGAYIHHLREGQSLSVEAFADRLDIDPSQLEAIEEGKEEAPDKVIRQLPAISNAYEVAMQSAFGERWQKLKERGARAI